MKTIDEDNETCINELLEGLPADKLLTVRQVAATIYRSPEYVRQLVQSGDLKVLGGRTKTKAQNLIYRSSLVDYLKRHTV